MRITIKGQVTIPRDIRKFAGFRPGTDVEFVIGDDGVVRTCTVLKPGRVDRSPCGTGSSANLATMHARGLVRKGDVLTSRSIIGSAFRVEVKDETVVGNRPAILPRVTGRAWIYGLSQIGLDPTDPFPRGFALSDTWGPYVGEL